MRCVIANISAWSKVAASGRSAQSSPCTPGQTTFKCGALLEPRSASVLPAAGWFPAGFWRIALTVACLLSWTGSSLAGSCSATGELPWAERKRFRGAPGGGRAEALASRGCRKQPAIRSGGRMLSKSHQNLTCSAIPMPVHVECTRLSVFAQRPSKVRYLRTTTTTSTITTSTTTTTTTTSTNTTEPMPLRPPLLLLLLPLLLLLLPVRLLLLRGYYYYYYHYSCFFNC